CLLTDTTNADIYTLSLHAALPICDWPERWSVVPDDRRGRRRGGCVCRRGGVRGTAPGAPVGLPAGPSPDAEPTVLGRRRAHARSDRKSTRLKSSHLLISYAVFCLQ